MYIVLGRDHMYLLEVIIYVYFSFFLLSYCLLYHVSHVSIDSLILFKGIVFPINYLGRVLTNSFDRPYNFKPFRAYALETEGLCIVLY